ncbi:pyrroline-5-carboxylate reductase [Methanosarcinales archaeon]|nr:MAG: pyrroline-5-carboxylate reductase [Methanosarcinales archaeon]
MRIGIVGIGNIGAAILQGLLAAEKGDKIYISDVRKERLSKFESEHRVKICDSNADVAENADVVIIAVKPSDVKNVLTEIKHLIGGKVLISVAAGISTKMLEMYLGDAGGAGGAAVRVIRVMPNIGAVVGAAVSAICRGSHASDEDEAVAKEILSAIGDVYSVDEKHMDAITGLSGSGIAFMATVIDALADGGVYEGVQRDLALKIAAKTAEGAAKMISAGFSPEKIRELTASPGGTTIRGILQMEKGVRAAVMNAVIAAAKRSREIAAVAAVAAEKEADEYINNEQK